MSCQEIREQIAGYVAGALDDASRSALESHLSICPWCKQEATTLGAVWERLGDLTDEAPSPLLRARFETMLAAYNQGRDQTRPPRQWRWMATNWLEQWMPWRPATQMAMALICLLIGLIGGHLLTQPRSGSAELALLHDEVRHMKGLVTISLLQQQSASQRLQGINWSYRLDQPDRQILKALVDTVRHDSNVDVRLAAVDALHQFGQEALVREGLIEALLVQDSPMVQIALIDLMVELREKKSVDALRQLEQNQKANEAVRERAQWGLQQLT